MRKSLHDTETIDRYLLERMPAAEAEDFRVRMLIDADLAEQVRWQRRAHNLVRLEGLFGRLMSDAAFRQQIDTIFTH